MNTNPTTLPTLLQCLLSGVLGLSVAAGDATAATAQDLALYATIRAQVDTSLLVRPAGTTLPAASKAFVFDKAVLPSNLERILPQGELFEAPVYSGVEAEANSPNFQLEFNLALGTFLLTPRDDIAPKLPPPISGGDTSFILDARTRVKTLGFPQAETAGAVARHLRRVARVVGSTEKTSKAMGTKIFMDRLIGGVPVLGSRLVVSYDQAGSLRKIIGRWPTVAGSGHRLSTTLTNAQVADSVALQLASLPAGTVPAGRIPVTFVYVPTIREDRTIVLTLQAEATLPGSASGNDGGLAGKIRQVLVPLSQ